MKNNAIWWIIGIVIVVGLGYLIFNQPNKSATPSTKPVANEPVAPKVVESSEVTIGWIGPLTGDAAAYGIPLQKATMLAAEEINAAGGVGGKKLVVAYEDGNCDGKGGAAAAQKLISINKVQIIIGGTCSGETLGFTPIANENKVVVFSPSASSPDLTTKGGDYAFRFYPSDALAGKVAASYAMDTFKAKKAAVITANTDYAQGLHRVF
ncbi:MAG: ABC transporter substrate-binding protein, partial [Candidatus Uhrbacteria bacterium]|nr:ABC transporter substrate-binding protein [Candidatus Uhrbacteria bacterium]